MRHPAPSLWAATAPAGPATTPIDGAVAADVCVVGAGVLGLSLALHLAEAGARVVVLEAAAPGFAASGRNGGLVVPSFARLDPATAKRLLPSHGDALCHLVATGGERIWALIARHQIACEASPTGWLNPAHRPSRMPAVAARAEQWHALGRPVQVLDAREVSAIIGSDRFHGALYDPTGGHLNPLAYTRGLATAAIAAGAVIHTDSAATGFERADRHWRVRIATGAVSAERVYWCTNASDSLVATAAVPLVVHQMATEVLPAAVRARVLVGSPSLSDTRANLFSARWTADGRLGTGGMASWAPEAAGPRLAPKLAARLARELGIGEVRLTMAYAWTGVAALTPHFLPRLIEVAPGVIAPLACNGRGLCLTTALGAALATHALGRGALPLPLEPYQPIRAHSVAQYLPRLLLPLGDLQDRRK